MVTSVNLIYPVKAKFVKLWLHNMSRYQIPLTAASQLINISAVCASTLTKEALNYKLCIFYLGNFCVVIFSTHFKTFNNNIFNISACITIARYYHYLSYHLVILCLFKIKLLYYYYFKNLSHSEWQTFNIISIYFWLIV